jgi:hypothetical protein
MFFFPRFSIWKVTICFGYFSSSQLKVVTAAIELAAKHRDKRPMIAFIKTPENVGARFMSDEGWIS